MLCPVDIRSLQECSLDAFITLLTFDLPDVSAAQCQELAPDIKKDAGVTTGQVLDLVSFVASDCATSKKKGTRKAGSTITGQIKTATAAEGVAVSTTASNPVLTNTQATAAKKFEVKLESVSGSAGTPTDNAAKTGTVSGTKTYGAAKNRDATSAGVAHGPWWTLIAIMAAYILA